MSIERAGSYAWRAVGPDESAVGLQTQEAE
jgi:hypothetical protein